MSAIRYRPFQVSRLEAVCRLSLFISGLCGPGLALEARIGSIARGGGNLENAKYHRAVGPRIIPCDADSGRLRL